MSATRESLNGGDPAVHPAARQRSQQIFRFTHTYINVLNISLMTLSIGDDAKLNIGFRNRKLNHTETDKRTQSTNDDVDEVRSS